MNTELTASPLFQRLLGPAFGGLPEPIRRLHDGRPRKAFAGRCNIARGRHWLVPLIAAVMSLPRSGDELPVSIVIDATDDRETWSRDFAGTPLRSVLSESGRQLVERMGPMSFRFALSVQAGAIVWTLAGVKLLGLLPLRASWFSGVVAREFEQAGRYHFDVRAALPFVGPLVHYQGWLDVGA